MRPESAKMWPVGWEALEQWGDDVVRIKPLTGGVGVNVDHSPGVSQADEIADLLAAIAADPSD